jgi:hypothetical protein
VPVFRQVLVQIGTYLNRLPTASFHLLLNLGIQIRTLAIVRLSLDGIQPCQASPSSWLPIPGPAPQRLSGYVSSGAIVDVG